MEAMSSYQGDLDGLCGVYAIAAAFELSGVREVAEVWQEACKGIARTRWPKLLWEGTTFGDLSRMVRRCLDVIPGTDHISVSYPFSRNAPISNADFWEKFDGLFDTTPNARCAIIGLTRPSAHWIVAFRETATRISFIDADPHRPYVRKNRGSLYAGQRHGNPNIWMIDRREVILFNAE
jgi:hypothetical protein